MGLPSGSWHRSVRLAVFTARRLRARLPVPVAAIGQGMALLTVRSPDGKAMKALCDAVVLAESDDIVIADGNPYFPRDAMRTEYFRESSLTTVCGWKGTARYWDVVVEGRVLTNVVWSYDTPKPAADNIRERFAFYRGKGVELVD